MSAKLSKRLRKKESMTKNPIDNQTRTRIRHMAFGMYVEASRREVDLLVKSNPDVMLQVYRPIVPEVWIEAISVSLSALTVVNHGPSQITDFTVVDRSGLWAPPLVRTDSKMWVNVPNPFIDGIRGHELVFSLAMGIAGNLPKDYGEKYSGFGHIRSAILEMFSGALIRQGRSHFSQSWLSVIKYFLPGLETQPFTQDSLKALGHGFANYFRMKYDFRKDKVDHDFLRSTKIQGTLLHSILLEDFIPTGRFARYCASKKTTNGQLYVRASREFLLQLSFDPENTVAALNIGFQRGRATDFINSTFIVSNFRFIPIYGYGPMVDVVIDFKIGSNNVHYRLCRIYFYADYIGNGFRIIPFNI